MDNIPNVYDPETIEECRQDFITNMITAHGGKRKLKYVGEMFPKDVPRDHLKRLQSRIKGTEIMVEYHLFEFKCGSQGIFQWRLV